MSQQGMRTFSTEFKEAGEDYGDTLLDPQLSASAWARGAVGEDRGRSLAAGRSRKGRRAERAANWGLSKVSPNPRDNKAGDAGHGTLGGRRPRRG